MTAPTARSVEDLPSAAAWLYAEAEISLVRLIGRRLARGLSGGDRDPQAWARGRLGEVSRLRRDTSALVRQLATDGDAAARHAVAVAWRNGDDQAVVALRDAGMPSRAPDARHGAAVRVVADALVGELRPVQAAILPRAEDVYRRAVAGAVARHLAAGMPLRYAAQSAWQALVDQGVTGLTDRAGRRWRLHTWVEMAVRTAVTRAVAQAVVDRCVLAGNRFVWVTDRPGECPLCRPFEHRVLALWGQAVDVEVSSPRAPGRLVPVRVKATLEQARAAGLHHPQCRHDLWPFVPGVTRLRAGIPDPAGWEARQRQREIERHLRRWRAREAGALTREAARDAAARVAAWDAEMERHLAGAGLDRLRHRESPGAGWEAGPARRDDPVGV